MSPLVIFGTGGMGREALAIARAVNGATGGLGPLNFVADWPEDLDAVARSGVDYLGTPEDAVQDGSLPPGFRYIVAVGDSAARESIDTRLQALGWKAATLVHPSAYVGPDVEVGPGSVICAFAALTTNVRLGRGTIVNVAATVSHDAVVGDFVTMSPHAAILGRVVVGDRSTIHAGAVVLPRVRIGSDCTIGAGAVVLRDIPDGQQVAGVPARLLREVQ